MNVLEKATNLYQDPEFKNHLDALLTVASKHMEEDDDALSTLIGVLVSKYKSPDKMIANLEGIKIGFYFRALSLEVMPAIGKIERSIKGGDVNPV